MSKNRTTLFYDERIELHHDLGDVGMNIGIIEMSDECPLRFVSLDLCFDKSVKINKVSNGRERRDKGNSTGRQ